MSEITYHKLFRKGSFEKRFKIVITKSSYETKLRKMTSQSKLLTQSQKVKRIT